MEVPHQSRNEDANFLKTRILKFLKSFKNSLLTENTM